MCLGLYVASRSLLAISESPELSVQEIDPTEDVVRQNFSLPHVRYLGAHTGCSCGFPHVIAESPFVWFEEFEDEHADREKNIGSLSALVSLLRVMT